jgi:hypothetical protein
VERFSRILFAACVTALWVFLPVAVVDGRQRQPVTPAAGHRPVIVSPDKHDVSPALRDLPVIPPQAGRRRGPHPPLRIRPSGRPAAEANDPAAQMELGLATPSTVVNFEGINNVDGVLPPDTNGDIGPNHYVQWVNLSFAIYDRSGNQLYGPADGTTIWQGFGGPCESNNDGDPIVLYDHLANRWLLTQFALPNFPNGPYYQCVAVTTSGDPQGAYYRYQFAFSKLNDYPKFGVWPDGYYMAINQFSFGGFPFGSFSWAGQGVAAFDRARMLNGQTATMVYFDLQSVDTNLGGMLPSELDGVAPPAGSPNYFVQVDDDAWGYSPDQLQIWKFAVNWASPFSSTFTKHKTLPTAAFDSNLCNYDRNCIPQPGTNARLDAISDRLMYRLQYGNLGTHEALVVNHTVDVSGNDRAGVRWYEVRNPGSSTATVHQQGTFAPGDGAHRWMGSAAMDTAGNIALGYNTSSGTVSPSIRYTARCASDPLGQMTQGEGDLIGGSGSQTSSSSRWGDYSMLGVDPVDGLTFWFTGEYYMTTGTAPWRTRVGSFKLDTCGGGGGTPPVAPSGLAATATSSSQISLAWADNSDDESGFRIERCQNAGCTNFSQIAELGSNVTTFGDSGLAASTTYAYRARAFNAAGTSAYSNVAEGTTQAPPAAINSHVGDLDRSSTSQGSTWTANVTVSVHDTNHAPVANATISGSWSGGATGSATCTTNGSGQCTVSRGSIRKNRGSVTFSVTAVTHASLTYVASANHDPDGDSNGTSIAVNKP